MNKFEIETGGIKTQLYAAFHDLIDEDSNSFIRCQFDPHYLCHLMHNACEKFNPKYDYLVCFTEDNKLEISIRKKKGTK